MEDLIPIFGILASTGSLVLIVWLVVDYLRRRQQTQAAAVFLDLALTRGDDFALLGLFLGGVRNDDSAHLLFALVEALNDDAVV